MALSTPYVDARGVIQPLFKRRIGSAVLIESKTGAVRAQHWHRTDWHYCYMLAGEVEYLERPLNFKGAPARFIFKAGEMFFTPPLVEHAMLFKQDSRMVVLANRHRTSEDYENDVVRLTEPLK